LVGIYAEIGRTATSIQGATEDEPGGLESIDPNLSRDATGNPVPLIVMQGGAALESSYRLLNDNLVVGLNAGWASGDDAPGFGLRSVIKQEPQPGDTDGKQYGACIPQEGEDEDSCSVVDNNITNFKFDPGYGVDLILFREILGTVTDAFYVKPHLTYFLTPDIGVRGDLITSFAQYASSTAGNANPLGVELDATAFYRTDDGFHFNLQYGFLFPLAGFNHSQDENGKTINDVDERFAKAQPASTFQALVGVSF